MYRAKSIPVIASIFWVLFARQAILSESHDHEDSKSELARSHNSSARGNYIDSKDEDIFATYFSQDTDCGKEPAPPNNSHLPQYLVIGDSIARGMLPLLKTKLEDITEAHIIPGTPETAADGARCIKVWVGPNLDRWDVISFNFGLNDSIKTTEPDRANYGLNIRDITTYLTKTKAGKKGKLISILTTPTANTSCCPNTTEPWNFPCPYSIQSYNDIIRNEMKYFNPPITVDDLYSLVNLYCCHHRDCFFDHCDLYQSSPNSSYCQTNFNQDGWNYLATSVSSTVKQVLQQVK